MPASSWPCTRTDSRTAGAWPSSRTTFEPALQLPAAFHSETHSGRVPKGMAFTTFATMLIRGLDAVPAIHDRAHRLATARNATRVLVFERGHIVETGTFDELVARGGRFAELARAQFIVSADAEAAGSRGA